MLRLRFSAGLILGLILGLVAGASLLLLWKRPAGTERETLTLQLQDLTRRLDDTRSERDRLLRQAEQFEKLAAQMTAGLTSLEQRVAAVQAGQEETKRRQSEPTATRTVRDPTPTQPVPTAVPTHAPTAADPPPEAAPAAGGDGAAAPPAAPTS